jgi:predicted RecA/RadA family phage recombinase
MVDAIPFYEDGDELTGTATAAITGKQFVKISGNRQPDGTVSLAPAGAGDRAIGVAMFDIPLGKRGTIHTISSHHVMPVVAAAPIVAGSPVKTAAAGQCTPSTTGDASVGIALDGAASGFDAMIALERFTA